MLRSFSRIATIVTLVASAQATAQAQYYYPGGYGGWGGWGGGTTAAGSTARGMGVFAAGAGVYNQQTAEARSMNVNTNMRLNEYIYQSQAVSTRKYHQELAARRNLINTSADETARRLRENPTAADIRSGDALNVVLDQVNSPQVYLRTSELASKSIPSSLVKNIPFKYAIQAITISLGELSQRGVPDALRDNPAFEQERQVVRAILKDAKQESDSTGQVSPEKLSKARTAIMALKNKVDSTLEAGAPGRKESDNFLKALFGLTKMLETPDVSRFLKELDTVPTTTLGELLGFMNSFNLRFGPADSGSEQAAYSQLYPMLVALRDQLGPQVQASANVPVAAPDPKNATEFFSGMQYDHLKQAGAVPTPPAAAQDPIR